MGGRLVNAATSPLASRLTYVAKTTGSVYVCVCKHAYMPQCVYTARE